MNQPDISQFLVKKPIFRRDDLIGFLADAGLTSPPKVASKQIGKMIEGGQIDELRKNLYSLRIRPEEGPLLWPDPYLVGSRVYPDGIIGHAGALALHLGLPTPSLIHVLTEKTPRHVSLESKPELPAFHGACPSRRILNRMETGVVPLVHVGMTFKATSIERTLVDLFECWDSPAEPGSSWDTLERILPLKCPKLDQDSLCSYLQQLGNATGSARLGAFLERHQYSLGIHPQTLRQILEMRPKDPVYWEPKQKGANSGRKHFRWNLIIPDSLSGWKPRDSIGATFVDHSDDPFKAFGDRPDAETLKIEAKLDSGELEELEVPEEPSKENETYPVDVAGDPIKHGNHPETKHRVGPSRQSSEVPEGPILIPMLKKRFGYDAFRDGQEPVLRTLLAGEDALAILPTGAGKSLIFQLWSALNRGLVLVISPTISLMDDQVDEALKRGLRAACLHTGQEGEYREAVLDQARAGALDLLFISPEGLFPLMWSAPWLATRVRLAVVDEAHCIALWGHEFRPAYLELHNIRNTLGSVPILGLTATATDQVKGSILYFLDMQNPYVYSGPVSRPNLHLEFQSVKGGLQARLPYLFRFLSKRAGQQGIIYCATRGATELVTKALISQGCPASAYHAGLDMEERRKVHQAFKEEPDRIVVATIAFGMGINKDDVRFVVHLNLPGSIEGYVQEIGRAGRDGKRADCLLLHSGGDFHFQRWLVSKSAPVNQGVRIGQVGKVKDFASSKQCRHQAIAAYFNQDERACGSRCDRCLGRLKPKAKH